MLLKRFFVVVCSSALLISCSTNSQQGGTPALFKTKAEAEAAAKNFNCNGAHKMNDRWMPCERHENHESHHKH